MALGDWAFWVLWGGWASVARARPEGWAAGLAAGLDGGASGRGAGRPGGWAGSLGGHTGIPIPRPRPIHNRGWLSFAGDPPTYCPLSCRHVQMNIKDSVRASIVIHAYKYMEHKLERNLAYLRTKRRQHLRAPTVGETYNTHIENWKVGATLGSGQTPCRQFLDYHPND